MQIDSLQTCDVIETLPRSSAAAEKRQECVLLIEDNEEAMLLVRYALQEYGDDTYRLEWADGLSAGLHRLAKGGVDLVLLDLGLPESSGHASYAAVRKAAPDLPILVLTGDTREQTETEIAASGVEDFLVKDDVSGSLLLQAIRTALYANRRWRERKLSHYKQTPQFHWAEEKCQALYVLCLRLLKLHRIESIAACGKAIAAIAHDYIQNKRGVVGGYVDLLLTLERLARAVAAQGHKDLARQYRAMIRPPENCDETFQVSFDTTVHQGIAELDKEKSAPETETPSGGEPDLAMALRQIMAEIPGL